MLLNCSVGEDSWESFGLQGDPTIQSYMKSIPNIYWKDWCWSWNSNNLVTWCKELTRWNRPWCWERLKAAREEDNRGWDSWMGSPTRWTWIWATLGVGEVQGSLECCISWGRKDSDMTEWLNWTFLQIWKNGNKTTIQISGDRPLKTIKVTSTAFLSLRDITLYQFY